MNFHLLTQCSHTGESAAANCRQLEHMLCVQEPFCLTKAVPTSVATPCRETWQGRVSWLAIALSLMLFQAPLLVQLQLCLRLIKEHDALLHTPCVLLN